MIGLALATVFRYRHAPCREMEASQQMQLRLADPARMLHEQRAVEVRIAQDEVTAPLKL
jgi:hypothetical protein